MWWWGTKTLEDGVFLLWLDKGHDDHKGLTLETHPYDVANNYIKEGFVWQNRNTKWQKLLTNLWTNIQDTLICDDHWEGKFVWQNKNEIIKINNQASIFSSRLIQNKLKIKI